MATVKKQGKGYKITVSCGYAADGKQRREHMTWVPEPGMSEEKAAKEAQRQAVLFENKVKGADVVDSRMKLEPFSKKFMEDYGKQHLKAKTYQSYTENLVRINAALGHIRLCDLRPTHINSFYKNLQESGARGTAIAICKIDLAAELAKQGLSMVRFAKAIHAANSTVQAANNKSAVSVQTAQKIATALDMKLTEVFEIQKRAEPLAPATVLAYHRTLSAVLSKAVKWGYLNSNPAERAEKPKLGNHEAAYLDEEDAKRLLELLQNEPIRWRTLITFDLLSGLRRGELLGLCWEDIDMAAQVVQIRQTSNYLPGKGVYTGTPKTRTSRRPIRLSRSAILALQEYKEWQDGQAAKLGELWSNKDNRVFTSDDGRPVFPDGVSAWFSDFIKRSGLPHVTIHSLRHTYASLMISDGVPLVVVSHQLGHAQASTTANIYAHVIAAAEVKSQELLDDKFQNIVGPANTKKAAGK